MLRVESLEPSLHAITFRKKDILYWNLIGMRIPRKKKKKLDVSQRDPFKKSFINRKL